MVKAKWFEVGIVAALFMTLLGAEECDTDDVDGDGYIQPADCDDTDPLIYPGAPDIVGDVIDSDCDGEDGQRPGTTPPDDAIRVCGEVELNLALSQLSPGDDVVLCAGQWDDLVLRVNAEGTEAAPITIWGDLPGKTYLRGRSRVALGGAHLVVNGLIFQGGVSEPDGVIIFRFDSDSPCRDCRVTNTVIDGMISAEETKWVRLFGQRNRVDHSYFRGKPNKGATLVVERQGDDADHHVIDHNAFVDRPILLKPDGTPDNDGESIRIGQSSTHTSDSFTLVAYNVFDDADGEIEIITSKAGSNRFLANTFRRSQGLLTLRHGDNATVDGNYFFAEGEPNTGGIRVVGSGHSIVNNYVEGIDSGSEFRGGVVLVSGEEEPAASGYQPVVGVDIVNNTFVGCEQSLILGTYREDKGRIVPPREVVIANNLIAEAVGSAIREDGHQLEETTLSSNLYDASSLGAPLDGFESLSVSMLEDDEHGLNRPPLVEPILNGGDQVFGSTMDFDGQPRVDAPDVGADELSDTAPSSTRFRRPRSREEVGPVPAEPSGA